MLAVSALLPSAAWCLVWPARVVDAQSKVGEYLVLDADREGRDAQGESRLAHAEAPTFSCRCARLGNCMTARRRPSPSCIVRLPMACRPPPHAAYFGTALQC